LSNPVNCQPEHFRLEEGRPLAVEVGCGNGHFLSELARGRPDWHFLGIDLRASRILRAGRKAMLGGIGNLGFLVGDARLFLEGQIAPGRLAELYVNFPDPWPKYRHRRHRLNQPDFLALLVSRLAPGGRFCWTCDYYPQIVEVLAMLRRMAPSLLNAAGPCGFLRERDDLPETLYERKWRAEARPVFYLRMVKQDG
jgi:tRNA (guanine-N7-)-methyltransferase